MTKCHIGQLLTTDLFGCKKLTTILALGRIPGPLLLSRARALMGELAQNWAGEMKSGKNLPDHTQ